MDILKIKDKGQWNPIESHFKKILLLILVCSCVVFIPPIIQDDAVIAGLNWYIITIPIFMFGTLASLLYAMTTKGVNHG